MNSSKIYSELGEGIYLDESTNYIYWVDINNNMLFVATPLTVNSYKFDTQVSAVLFVDNNIIHLASSDGIVSFDVERCSISLLDKTPDFYDSESYRSNDGNDFR